MDGQHNQSILYWQDYLIFILTLVISVIIGIYQSFKGRDENTMDNYLMGNRKLKLLPVLMSLVMTEISGSTILGYASEMYIYGTVMWLHPLGSAIGLSLSAYLYVPLMRKLKLTSAFQYHNVRFNSVVIHKLCVIMGITVTVIALATVTFSPSIALEAVSGIPVWASIICTGVLAIMYTTSGGMKAVIWTDTFQSIMLFLGLLVILILGCIKVGGLGEVWRINNEGGRLNFLKMSFDPTERLTFWSVLTPLIFSVTDCAFDQSTIQRYNAVSDLRSAYLVILLQIPVRIIVLSIICLCGLTAYAYYDMNMCDPFRSGKITNQNQILPYFLADGLGYKGLTGLFIAVMFCGALSTVSSLLHGLATITWKDFLEKHFDKVDEFKKTLILKFVCIVYGVIAIGMSYGLNYFQGNILQFSIALVGAFVGPLVGVVFAGTFIPWVTGMGMACGMFTGFCLSGWINIGQLIYFPHLSYLNTTVTNCTFGVNETARVIPPDREDIFWLYQLSFVWPPLMALFVTIFVGFVASVCLGRQDPKQLDPRTVLNLSEKICLCCPKKCCKEKCTCGIPFDQIEDNNKEIKEERSDKPKIKEFEHIDIENSQPTWSSMEFQTYL